MSKESIEKRARELLAAEHKKCDRNTEADLVLAGDVTVLGQIALNAIAAALAPQWQPIETAPKDGTFFLAVVKGFTPAVAQWTTDFRPQGEFTFLEPGMFAEESHWDEMLAQNDPWKPTHWQPLPAPLEAA